MTSQERGLFLKFVTSCERPPSLGFGSLDPKFTIQRVDTNGNYHFVCRLCRQILLYICLIHIHDYYLLLIFYPPVDDSRLPTASTCFNILKLPTYSSAKALKTKLMHSIHSGSGFEMS